MGFSKKKVSKIKLLSILLMALILIMGGYGVFWMYEKQVDNIGRTYESEIETLKFQIYENKKEVFFTTKDIHKGEVIKLDFLEKRTIDSSLSMDIFMSEKSIGKRSQVKILKDTPMVKAFIENKKVAQDIRLRELSSVLLQSDLKAYEFVDFRIRYGNGMEYTVLSKKRIEKIDLKNNTIWLSLNEKESLLLSSALVDRAIYQGTSFYVNRYIKGSLQNKQTVNYLANKAVSEQIALLEPENNQYEKALQSRELLEVSLLSLAAEDLSEIENSLSSEENYINNRVTSDQEQQESSLPEESDEKEETDAFN